MARCVRTALGSVVRCETPAREIASRPRTPRDAPGPAAAGRAARLPRHGDDRPCDGGGHGRVPRRAGLVGGRPVPPGPAAAPRPCRRARAAGAAGRRTSRATAGSSRTTAGASTGRCSSRGTGMARRAAPDHDGHLDLLPLVRRRVPAPHGGRAPADRGVDAARAAIGTATSTAGRSRVATSTSCAAAQPSRSSRSSGTTTRTSGRWRGSSGMSSAATRTTGRGQLRRRAIWLAWRGRSPGSGRHDEALGCLDVRDRG